jgi:cephalosporin hydroxylase
MLANADGKKISLDLPGGPYGFEEDSGLDMQSGRDFLKRSWAPNVFVVHGDSHAMQSRRQIDELLLQDELDFLFIDGDHTYEGVRADYEMYRGFVRKDGFIAFHDINDSMFHRQRNVGVSSLWRELEGPKFEINVKDNWGGIGVLQRKCGNRP